MMHRRFNWSCSLQGSQHHLRVGNWIKHLLHSLLQTFFKCNQQPTSCFKDTPNPFFILFNLYITIIHLHIVLFINKFHKNLHIVLFINKFAYSSIHFSKMNRTICNFKCNQQPTSCFKDTPNSFFILFNLYITIIHLHIVLFINKPILNF